MEDHRSQSGNSHSQLRLLKDNSTLIDDILEKNKEEVVPTLSLLATFLTDFVGLARESRRTPKH
jgi:hypothetical protein